MENTILHSGSLTVLEDGTTLVAGKLPSLDEIARVRAYRRYMAIVDDPATDDWRSVDRFDHEEL